MRASIERVAPLPRASLRPGLVYCAQCSSFSANLAGFPYGDQRLCVKCHDYGTRFLTRAAPFCVAPSGPSLPPPYIAV